MNPFKKQPGVFYFSLLEVIIAIAIIAILATIVLGYLIPSIKSAACSKHVNNMQAVVTDCTGATVPFLNETKFEECLKKAQKTFAELKKDTLCFDTTKNATLWASMKQVNAKVKELAKEDSAKWSKYVLKYP